KAYEKLDTYDPSFKFFSWLYKIAVNESINYVKKRNRETRLNHEHVASQKSAENRLIENETGEHIQNALATLKLDHRIVLILKHFLDLSYKEIGGILEIPVKRVKSRLFTGRQLLKDILIKQGFIR
ncbi:MAG: sigma-70 family RNA polymerase sigma factor, partial [Candidatus Krumholzibacteria bacterium]|nr:sigma-70 family RNA polymerase sigma factor [Candidatus Krumholzibacteria bacterium]